MVVSRAACEAKEEPCKSVGARRGQEGTAAGRGWVADGAGQPGKHVLSQLPAADVVPCSGPEGGGVGGGGGGKGRGWGHGFRLGDGVPPA